MNNFIFENSSKVYFGEGCVKEYLSNILSAYGDTVMLCYGGGSIKKNGIYDEVITVLKKENKAVVEFSGIPSNPTYSKVLEGVKLAKKSNADLILAVGGGSVIDCCKAISLGAKYDDDIWADFWARPGVIDFEPLPLGMIVTVSGTGSECNGGAVITNEELMLNTGLRTAEALGLINSDIDLEKKVIHIQRGVKEAQKRAGTERKSGREIVVGKLKTASSKRIVPLNETAIQAIIELRNERYFGEDAPLIPDADGNFTRPLNLRKRFYSILDAAGIEKKGLHSLRHTFATKLVTGVRAEDGTVKALTPRQVADLLGHTTSEITEMYYVKRNTDMLMGVTNGFEL